MRSIPRVYQWAQTEQAKIAALSNLFSKEVYISPGSLARRCDRTPHRGRRKRAGGPTCSAPTARRQCGS